MSTILLYLGILILLLAIASKIPGVEHLVKPIIELFFWIFKIFLENGGAWLVYLVKTLSNAHITVIKNLLFSADQLDPTYELRAKAQAEAAAAEGSAYTKYQNMKSKLKASWANAGKK